MGMRTLGRWTVGVLLLAAAAARAAPSEEVADAVARGVEFLKQAQNADGTWSYSGPMPPMAHDTAHPVGVTALAGLALLESGVPADDPVIRKAAFAIRYGTADLVDTYDLSLAVMFLDRLGDRDDHPLIEAAVYRLLAGQNGQGGWSYTCPLKSTDLEVRRLRTLAESKTASSSGGNASRGGRKSGVLQNQPRNGPRRMGSMDDNSNTQFATFALWIGRRHQLRVDAALAAVERRFRYSQNGDGGWGYGRYGMNHSTVSMTCAGLLGLAVGHGVALLRTGARPAAALDKSSDLTQDLAIRRGLLFLANHLEPALGPEGRRTPRGRGREDGPGRDRPGPRRSILGNDAGSEYYFLWSLERVAAVYALQTIGNKDWFAVGSKFLLDRQEEDGSWSGNLGETVETSFALFFLRQVNLARDLTVTLKGQIKDPGGMNMKPKEPAAQAPQKPASVTKVTHEPGTSSRPASSPAPARVPDLPPPSKREESETAEPATAAPVVPAPTLPAPATAGPAAPASTDAAGMHEHDVARLRDQLVQAAPAVQEALVRYLRDTKGSENTEALATAIPQLNGDLKRKARDALANRLTRMTPTTLRDKLHDDNPEVRSAAALACGMKEDRGFVPDLIGLLEDREAHVRKAAVVALKALTNQDLGPGPGASLAQWAEAEARWRVWWSKNGGRP